MNSLQNDPYYMDNPSTRSPRQMQRGFDHYPGQNGSSHFPIDDLPRGYEPHFPPPRMNATMPQGYYDGWNSFNQNHQIPQLGTTIRKPSNRRPPIPQMWQDQPHAMGPFGGMGPLGIPSLRSDHMHEVDEELIPTAIVIKNIPFAVKKEQLVQLMTELCLPLPYAFNYHFDHGVFRGLAFANFQTPEETATVIEAMNHRELHGRKLRVEYKKMLPQAERDRIEREKRERRGQLEEQHRPLPPSQLQTQPSMSSLSSRMPGNSPSPLSARNVHANAFNPWSGNGQTDPAVDIDMNDPVTLQYYTKLIQFQGDPSQELMTFPPGLGSDMRRVIHGLAHHLDLGHTSYGIGDDRQINIYKRNTGTNGLSPIIPQPGSHLDANKRVLYRAATTDFSEARDPNLYGTIGRQSSGLLGPGEPHGLAAPSSLRAAKSFADLRSYTPSPAQSLSSFPAGLTGNLNRYEYAQNSPGSSRSNITPTTTLPGGGEGLLVNGLNNMSLGTNSGFSHGGGSPHRLRGMVSWDREVPGPIGGHRTYSANQDESSRSRTAMPTRQPRGPIPERGTGFPRGRPNGHQSRGSDELSNQNNGEHAD